MSNEIKQQTLTKQVLNKNNKQPKVITHALILQLLLSKIINFRMT